uniref:Uncharacterized protein n=1 Tax=Arundo donax TaxID=35708 RepID=A0A0A9FHE6_ARUDO
MMPALSAASAAARCSGVSCACPASDAISCAATSASFVLCVKLSGFMAAVTPHNPLLLQAARKIFLGFWDEMSENHQVLVELLPFCSCFSV